MPVVLKKDSFSGMFIRPSDLTLLTPQARIMAVLMPDNPALDPIDWPIVNRPQLGKRAGYSAVSGTVTRALNGVRPGSKSGPPQLGLIARGFIAEVFLDLDGRIETNYRATHAGIKAYQEYLTANGGPPSMVKNAATCINNRYKNKDKT